MNQPRPVFHPITPPANVSDEELADFARSKGVGTMVTSAPQIPSLAPQIAQDAPSEAPGTSRAPSPRKAPAPKKTAPAVKPAPDLKLSVRIPDYVSRELNIRAASQRCTARHLVLQGLQAIGFEIAEGDLNPDERRLMYRKQDR